jgi:hypothetical protein
VDGAEPDLETALAAVRPAAERFEATQFEALTAAAFVAFREAEVEAAVVEAGLGGRHDATNVLDETRVVVDFPLVPTTCTAGSPACGSPSAARSARIRSSPKPSRGQGDRLSSQARLFMVV